MSERFARDARAALVLAEQEARELGDHAVAPEHLLVGVLQSAGRELAAVLSEVGLTVEAVRDRLPVDDRTGDTFDGDANALLAIGIDLKAVRDNVNRLFGPDTFEAALPRSGRHGRRRGQSGFDRDAKKVLELAQRAAVACQGKTVGGEHLLLGILRGGDRYTVGLIAEHVEVGSLHSAVLALLDTAA